VELAMEMSPVFQGLIRMSGRLIESRSQLFLDGQTGSRRCGGKDKEIQKWQRKKAKPSAVILYSLKLD